MERSFGKIGGCARQVDYSFYLSLEAKYYFDGRLLIDRTRIGELLEVQVSSSIFVDCVSLHAHQPTNQALTVKEKHRLVSSHRKSRWTSTVFSRETRENGMEKHDVSNNSRTPATIYRSQSVPPDLAAFRKHDDRLDTAPPPSFQPPTYSWPPMIQV